MSGRRVSQYWHSVACLCVGSGIKILWSCLVPGHYRRAVADVLAPVASWRRRLELPSSLEPRRWSRALGLLRQLLLGRLLLRWGPPLLQCACACVHVNVRAPAYADTLASLDTGNTFRTWGIQSRQGRDGWRRTSRRGQRLLPALFLGYTTVCCRRQRAPPAIGLERDGLSARLLSCLSHAERRLLHRSTQGAIP